MHCTQRTTAYLRLTRHLRALPRIRTIGCAKLRSGPFCRLDAGRFNTCPNTVLAFSLTSHRTYFHFVGHLRLVQQTAGLFSGGALTVRPTDAVCNSFARRRQRDVSIDPGAVHLSIKLRDTRSLLASVDRTLMWPYLESSASCVIFRGLVFYFACYRGVLIYKVFVCWV